MFWYESDIKNLENKPVILTSEKKKVLFYGSSTIRLWETIDTDFPEFTVVNQGFGGSTLAACCWFFKRVIPQHKPDIIVLYAGDNDLGDGRHPEEVYLNFINMMALIKQYCGDIPVAFLSIKLSISRLHLYNSIIFTNQIIKAEIAKNYPQCHYVNLESAMYSNESIDQTLFENDGLHLSEKGYTVLKDVVRSQFLDQFMPNKKEKRQKI
jgi:lysophospholipase L1-like esterase